MQKTLSKEANAFRRSYLTMAYDLHQDVFFAQKKFNTDLIYLLDNPTQENYDIALASLNTLRRTYNYIIPFRYIHGPLDYPQRASKKSLQDLIFAKNAKFDLDKTVLAYIEDSSKTIDAASLLKAHQLYANEEIYIGLLPMGELLNSQKDKILSSDERLKEYLLINNQLIAEFTLKLVKAWSPYEKANFANILRTRPEAQFLGFTFTSFEKNITLLSDKVQNPSPLFGMTKEDYYQELKSLKILWTGKYLLLDQRQYIRTGLNQLVISAEIDNYLITIEKTRVNKNEDLFLASLASINRTFKQKIKAFDYDKNVQKLPYIVPNDRLNSIIIQKQESSENTPFAEREYIYTPPKN